MSDSPRIVSPNREQPYWDLVNLEGWLPPDHQARSIWAFVGGLDLSALYDKIASRGSNAGRPATDPAVLLALWLLATVEGVGSARELDRRVSRDLPYMWLAGGVSVNYHGLADFRVGHGDVLDKLLTDSLTALIAEGLVSLDTVLADGTKVRANASRNSYRSAKGLMKLEERVRKFVSSVKDDDDDDGSGTTRKQSAARKRATDEQLSKIDRARAVLDKIEEERQKRLKASPSDSKTRYKQAPEASVTDPEARKIWFSDSSIAPAYNVQIATTELSGIIVSAYVTDRRTDSGAGSILIKDIHERYGRRPNEIICDTTYITQKEIVDLGKHEVTVWSPAPSDSKDAKESSIKARIKRRAKEAPRLQDWRARMNSDEGDEKMAARKRVELTNAHLKNKGMTRFAVRGLHKTGCELLLRVLAHNFQAAQTLRKKVQA